MEAVEQSSALDIRRDTVIVLLILVKRHICASFWIQFLAICHVSFS